jgi:hypothetical protein
MEFKEVIKLFRKAIRRNDWGGATYIQILDDGSGEISIEGDTIIFEDEKDLIEILEKSLK